MHIKVIWDILDIARRTVLTIFKINPVLFDLNQCGNLRHITINYSNA